MVMNPGSPFFSFHDGLRVPNDEYGLCRAFLALPYDEHRVPNDERAPFLAQRWKIMMGLECSMMRMAHAMAFWHHLMTRSECAMMYKKDIWLF